MISLRNIFIAAVWKASRYINLIPSRRKIKIHRVKIVEGKGFEDNVLPSSLSLSSSRDLPEVSATCWILGSKAHTFPPAGRHLVAEQNRHDAEWRPSTWPLPLPPVPCISSTGIVKKKKRIFDLFAQPSFLPQPPLQPWNSRLLFADLIVNSGFRCGSTVCWLARKEGKQFGRDDKIKGIKNSARFKIYPVKNETRINGRSSIAFLHLHFPATFVNNIYLILSVSIIIILSLVVGRRSRELDKIIIVGGENRMTR